MKVKLCGFKEEQTLRAAINANCNFLGFIFVKNSPREITLLKAKELAKIIPPTIAKVAVVVDCEIAFLEKIIAEFQPDYLQFHGQETAEFLINFKKIFPQIKVIKAFKIACKDDLNQIKNFEEIADLFLLDGKNAGSGEAFDWQILENFQTKKGWFLSGGINAKNLQEAIAKTKAKMIDVSSGIEEIRGQKSIKLINELMQICQKTC
jgi:phosphoribosylanthranilate isomerase